MNGRMYVIAETSLMGVTCCASLTPCHVASSVQLIHSISSLHQLCGSHWQNWTLVSTSGNPGNTIPRYTGRISQQLAPIYTASAPHSTLCIIYKQGEWRWARGEGMRGRKRRQIETDRWIGFPRVAASSERTVEGWRGGRERGGGRNRWGERNSL